MKTMNGTTTLVETSIRIFINATISTRYNRCAHYSTELQDSLSRSMKTWQPSLDKRSKADDVYQRRLNHDVKAMGRSNYRTGSRFAPLADILDDKTMNWQNNTTRQVDDATEMNLNHLTDDTTSQTTNDPRLSIKRHVTQISSNNSKSKKHAKKLKFMYLVPPYT